MLRMQKKPKISVVIPAYNEEKTIGTTLAALSEQKTNYDFEVILVDNNSTDNTQKEAYKYKSRLKLTILTEYKKGRGIARARGCDEAQGDIILCTDSDTFVPPTWIENYMRHFQEHEVVAVTGPWYIHDCNFATNFIINVFQKVGVWPYVLVKGHYWITGLNFGIRKRIYQRAGGFDRTLNAHEDIEITHRIEPFGKIKYADDVYVVTSGRRYRNGFLAGIWQYEKTYIHYFLLHNKKIVLEDKR